MNYSLETCRRVLLGLSARLGEHFHLPLAQPPHPTAAFDGKRERFPDCSKLQFGGKNPTCESFKPWGISVKEQFSASKTTEAMGSELQLLRKRCVEVSIRRERQLRFLGLQPLRYSSQITAELSAQIPEFLGCSSFEQRVCLCMDWRLNKASPSSHLHLMKCL